MTHKDEWVLLIVIAKRSLRDSLSKLLLEQDGHGQLQTYAHGSAKDGLLRALGLKPENNKIFITSFIRKENIKNIFNLLYEKFHFEKPNTGLAFTIPLEKVSY